MTESEKEAWRTDLSFAFSRLTATYDSLAFAKRADSESITPLEKACYDFLSILKAGWPLFRQGRVGPPGQEPAPPVQRRQKLTLTLEDLDL